MAIAHSKPSRNPAAIDLGPAPANQCSAACSFARAVVRPAASACRRACQSAESFLAELSPLAHAAGVCSVLCKQSVRRCSRCKLAREPGFRVAPLPAGLGWIEFSGTVAQVEQAFGTQVDMVSVSGNTRAVLVSASRFPALCRRLSRAWYRLMAFSPYPRSPRRRLSRSRPPILRRSLRPPTRQCSHRILPRSSQRHASRCTRRKRRRSNHRHRVAQQRLQRRRCSLSLSLRAARVAPGNFCSTDQIQALQTTKPRPHWPHPGREPQRRAHRLCCASSYITRHDGGPLSPLSSTRILPTLSVRYLACEAVFSLPHTRRFISHSTSRRQRRVLRSSPPQAMAAPRPARRQAALCRSTLVLQ